MKTNANTHPIPEGWPHEDRGAVNENQNIAEHSEILCQLCERFREKFGRDPGLNDPVFFDPDADVPVPLEKQRMVEMWSRLADSMVARGTLSPESGYAMKKTGLLVTEKTKGLLTDVELDRWNDAILEYRVHNHDAGS